MYIDVFTISCLVYYWRMFFMLFMTTTWSDPTFVEEDLPNKNASVTLCGNMPKLSYCEICAHSLASVFCQIIQYDRNFEKVALQSWLIKLILSWALFRKTAHTHTTTPCYSLISVWDFVLIVVIKIEVKRVPLRQ